MACTYPDCMRLYGGCGEGCTPRRKTRTGKRAMNICEECGLPIYACNALAAYRKGVEEMARGRSQQAAEYFDVAKDHEAQFNAERRAAATPNPNI